MTTKNNGLSMRVLHRYLGFFLAGIMTMYSISGIVLIFRTTDFLKQEKHFEKTIETNVPAKELGNKLGLRRLRVDKQEGDIIYFEQGTYNAATGVANYTLKELPYLLDKMTKLHKSNTNQPLFYLNIFFGLSLLFFVISSFWMFRPSTSVFKKGLYFTLGGIILTLILIFV